MDEEQSRLEMLPSSTFAIGRRFVFGATILIATVGLCIAFISAQSIAPAYAADLIRVAVQRTGTAAWELAVARAHALDREAGLVLQVTELASPEAGKIALRGGAADIIVSDWLWVSRERALGASLTFYPYSTALGAVMVAPKSPIRTFSDLKGRKLAVAGGALDKSWLLLQAAMKQMGTDLKAEARIAYGAPVLLAEKLATGEMDATLNYWNICAGLEARGFRRVGEVSDVLRLLGAKAPVSLLGYVFSEEWANANREPLARFFRMTRRAKEFLAESDAEWERIAPMTGSTNATAVTILRRRYGDGIPRRPIAEEEADARILHRVLAIAGGRDLIGPGLELDPGTFYRADLEP